MTTLIVCALIACVLIGAYCLTRPTESLRPKDRCPHCGTAGTATLDPDDDGTLLWACPRCARRWVSIEGAL